MGLFGLLVLKSLLYCKAGHLLALVPAENDIE